MKILVVNNMVPFLRGGAERLADNLVRQLRHGGHEADLLRVPFCWQPADRLYDEMLACRMMSLFNVDRVIGLKFPAYLIPHPHKTIWLVHQYRQAYDLADSTHSNLSRGEAGDRLRQTIKAADNECFLASRDIHVISRVVRQRLARFNGFDGNVLHPPLDDPEIFRPETSRGYVFCGGRINACKRQHLLIEAMRHVRSAVKLIIGGPPDAPSDGQRLWQLVNKYQLHDSVDLQLGFLDREHLAGLVNHSLACACVPLDEDYGYVTLEAFYAGKPVLTTSDSGGVLDFVTHRQTGLITDPDPRALALAIDQLAENPVETARWGEAARDDIYSRDINWPSTVQKLVA